MLFFCHQSSFWLRRKEKVRRDSALKIVKVFNNNSVSVILPGGREAILLGNGIGILDTAILIGTGLGIGLAQSRACAVAACVYTVLNMVITVLGIGMPGGWLPLLGAVFGVITTFRFQDAWQLYCRTGAFPVDRRGRH